MSGRRVPRRTPSGTFRIVAEPSALAAWARDVEAGREPARMPSMQIARGIIALMDELAVTRAALEQRGRDLATVLASRDEEDRRLASALATADEVLPG